MSNPEMVGGLGHYQGLTAAEAIELAAALSYVAGVVERADG